MFYSMTSDFYTNEETGRTDYLRMVNHGFNACDYQKLCNVKGENYTSDEDTFRKIMLAEKAEADKAGMFICQVHGPWFVDDSTEESRAFNLQCMYRCIIGTALLGCPYMVVHPVLPHLWEDEPEKEWAFNLNVEYFSKVCDFASDYNVGVCIENMPSTGPAVSTIGQIATLLDAMDKKNGLACLDTGHANITKTKGDDVFGGMRACGKRLKTLHLHDNRGYFDEHRMPFTASFDWTTFKATLKEIGYDGAYSLEHMLQKDAPASFQDMFLRTSAVCARVFAE